jgi:UDP-N-acetylmuramyl pentapeptide phosphotransferase/UDP-N-acetylglucosamine-1-phosphate transferase
VVRRYALKKSLMDIPNDRSSHVQPTPRGGGLGFLLGFAIGLTFIFFLPNLPVQPDPFLGLILFPLAAIGFLDDRYNLQSLVRYGVQLGVAVLAVVHYGIFPQPWLTNFGTIGIIFAGLLTVIGFTALINFYNFMDGLDGIVASVTALQLSFITLYLNQPIWWLLIVALLGFLWWNWSPAKIFMGDVGSTVLGASIAIALIQTNNVTLGWSSLAITLPITADTIYTLFVRLSRRENIFQAHRTHIFQRLQQSGWSHPQVALTYSGLTLVIATLTFAFGAIGSVFSLIMSVLAIIIAELYLKRSKLTKPQIS